MIRPYRETDLEAVASLFTDAVHGLGCEAYTADQLAAWAPRPPDLDYWSARLAVLKTLVAEVRAELIGFISYKDDGHIDLLFTSPTQARRGVASALYREVEETLEAAGLSELSTEASLIARPFFEHRGFRVIEEQCVQRRGAMLRRFAMRKNLKAPRVQDRA